MDEVKVLTQEEIDKQDHDDFIQAAGGQAEEVEPLEAESVETPASVAAEPEIDLSKLPAATLEKLEEQLTAKIEAKLSGRMRNIEGHIGGIKDSLGKMTSAAKAAEKSGAEAPTGAQIAEAVKSGSKLAQLEEDFPEWAEAIKETRDSVLAQQSVREKTLTTQLEAARREAQDMAHRARQMAQLDNAHPDWEDIIKSKEYKEWLPVQPKELQALTASQKASDALKVIDAFKAAAPASASTNALTAQRRQTTTQRRLENAVMPTNGRTPVRTQPKTEHEEFLAAFKT
jgi:hypothetical protein